MNPSAAAPPPPAADPFDTIDVSPGAQQPDKARRWKLAAAFLLAVVALTVAAVRLLPLSGESSGTPPDASAGPNRPLTEEQRRHARWNEILSAPLHPRGPGAEPPADVPPPILSACTGCHRYTPPGLLPRRMWAQKIKTMFDLADKGGRPIRHISRQRVTRWFEDHAPEHLPHTTGRTDAGPGPIQWKRHPWRPSQAPEPRLALPAVAHLGFTRALDGPGSQLIFCDMRFGGLSALSGYGSELEEMPLGATGHPSHAVVTDLDGDGRQDLAVTDIGDISPSIRSRKGRILWLRGREDGSFENYTLAQELPRLAEVRAADLDADGDTDLIVSAFGWVEMGHLFWLENHRRADGSSGFQRHRLDLRPGAVSALPMDVDGDGRLDIVGLVTQHAEQVIAYLQRDDGFTPELLHEAPHPDWGYTGIEPVDLDGDGDLDLLLTNGDAMDALTPKPHHGLAWLENRGGLRFRYHHLTHLYGAHRALPTDLDGDGDLDIVACAMVPNFMRDEGDPPPRFEGLIWLERLGPERMARRVLEWDNPDHAALAAGDYDDDGDVDLAVGNLSYAMKDWKPIETWITVWENRGVNEDRAAAEETAPEEVIHIFIFGSGAPE